MIRRAIFAGFSGGLLNFGMGVLLDVMKPDISFLNSVMISLPLSIGLVLLALVASNK